MYLSIVPAVLHYLNKRTMLQFNDVTAGGSSNTAAVSSAVESEEEEEDERDAFDLRLDSDVLRCLRRIPVAVPSLSVNSPALTDTHLVTGRAVNT